MLCGTPQSHPPCYVEEMSTIGDRIKRWGTRKAARRLSKSVPFVGTAVAIGYLHHAVRRKGLVAGVIDSTLDAIPVVGTMKAGIELLITDEWFPDRPELVAEAQDGSRASTVPRAPGPPRR